MTQNALSITIEFCSRSLRSIEAELTLKGVHALAFAAQYGIDVNFLLQGGVFEIDYQELASLRSELPFIVREATDLHAFVSLSHPLSELPYAIHTGRELKLMLQGIKPLATFSDVYEGEPNFWVVPDDAFSSHVESGAIVRREFISHLPHETLDGPKRSRTVLYARKGEEWRIDAWIAMKDAASVTGWNEGFERLEGILLGYSAWQNDAFHKWRHSKEG